MGYRSEQLTTGRARSTLVDLYHFRIVFDLHQFVPQLHLSNLILLMSLNEVWEAASATPFIPLIAKDSQFSVGFSLLLLGKLLVITALEIANL